MARFFKNRKKLIGQAPGELTFIGQKLMERPRFRLISYNKENIRETETENTGDLISAMAPGHINWINIDGLHESTAISEVGKAFGLSPLVLDDIVNTDQRPKYLEDGNNIILFLKQLVYNEVSKSIIADHITLILGPDYVVSFQEKTGEFFNSIRERLRNNTGKLRKSNADYLMYRILDTIVDHYSVCLSSIGEQVEANEEKILSKNGKQVIEEIFRLKTEISYLRKTIRPVRDITKNLKNTDSELIEESSLPYFNDLDDLLNHALETADVYYIMIGDQLNIYNTNLANRANDVMKVLTMFAAIFIPLTFIAGIYGTNFEYIPELRFRYSYFIMLAIMAILAIVMIVYFRRKKWL
ncbi:MAG: magnesium/cobalt transporter CorA [Prolixibacteraceae bacterium]|nr:magnesium/cobalt transporter CorA [Prolixibacteraceae bacterium]